MMTRPRRISKAGWLALVLLAARPAPAEPAAWQQESGFRWAPLPVPAQGAAGFTHFGPDRTRVTFTNHLHEMASAANRILLNGAGLAAGDFDNDGRMDLFFCSLSGRSALFRNLGQFRFQDVTEAAGVGMPNRITRGAVFADINGDGWMDLLVATLADGVACFLNDGHGKFLETTAAAGTGSGVGSVTLALADVDGNGTLDLYVTNYRSEDIRDRGQVDLQLVRGQMVVPPKLKNRLLVVAGQVLEYGEPDQLLLNDGRGNFTQVSWTAGAFLEEDGKNLSGPPLDWGLTATFRDLNGDLFPDLYVCNDYWTPDRVWINDGQGRFRAITRLALRETCSSSMGVDFADIDRDGHLDGMVTDMLSRDPQLRKRQMPPRWPIPDPKHVIEQRNQIIQNTLLYNRGDGTYAEIANYAGVAASDWSWQPIFFDADLDGFPDLFVPAGHARDVQDMDAEQAIRARQHPWTGFTNAVERQKAFTQELMVHMRLYPYLAMPIFAFRNLGNLRFAEVSEAWGTGQRGVHHSLALADFDNDGDLDFAVNNLNAAAGLYQNNTIAPRVAVHLKGLPPNTRGIGAQVELRHGAVPLQVEEVISGGRYMCGSDPVVTLAAGNASTSMTLTVRWRSGRSSTIPGVVANRIYEIEEPQEPPARPLPPASTPAAGPTLFSDVSAQLRHVHKDSRFDDYQRQPLLPKKFSQLGPGVAWFDLTGDGWDDLIIGSGRGGQLSVFANNQHGGFQLQAGAPLNVPVTRDQTAVLGFTLESGQKLVLAGSSNYEDGLAAGAAVRQYDLAQRRIDDSMPGQPASTGPLALGDLDGDGDLDLFIGGRCLPGRYPEPASSIILRQNAGRFQVDPEHTRALRNVGLVSGARWSDLDGDGWAELILACEWGPVRVFKNRAGTLTEITSELGLDRWTGWWSGVSVGDLDGDGQLEIVASNWGLNSAYSASLDLPARVYYGDLSGRGTADVLEAEFDPGIQAYTPRQRPDVLSAVFPYLLDRFASANAFSRASVAQVVARVPPEPRFLEASTLASMVFLNRSGRFEPVPLPPETQWTPAWAVQVADFNGDGHEDIFLSQNFFETEPETPRLAAGRGLLLEGDGTGKLLPVPGQRSGIVIHGEQRGAAVSDFDQDGRVDLVVTQNSAATRLFRNILAQPGLRVRLRGPAGNPDGIGATLRLLSGDRAGPAREVACGSGYWSQDSSVQVLSMASKPDRLWVRWPGGRVTTSALTDGMREITVSLGEAVPATKP